MASKSLLFLLATLLLVTTKVAHGDTAPSITYPSKPKPSPTPVVKPPTTPTVKPPTPPVVKPPTPVVPPPLPPAAPIPPPVYKPPTTPVSPPKPVLPPPVALPPPAPVPPPVAKPPPTPVPPPTYIPPVTPPPPTPPRLPPIKSLKECGALCEARCSKHSRPNLCQRACVTCCQRCKCVPPGTYGNREMCGTCYSQMKTHRGQLKCP